MRLKFVLNIEYISSLLQLLYLSLFLVSLILADLVVAIKSIDSPCGKQHLNSSEGIIRSPNYPFPYPYEIKCEWKIYSPENATVKINIVDLDIEGDRPCHKPPCCLHQWLLVPSEGGKKSKVLCNNNSTERNIIASQNVTVIKYFSSNPKGAGRGFQISYSIIQKCKPQELQCINGNCVSNNSFCNGVNDCGDDSDEMYCPQIMQTSSKYDFLARQIIPEISNSLVEPCIGRRVLCPLSRDRCYLPHLDVCDGKFDCPKGEDEVDCAPGCPNQIACSSGDGCYYPLQRCNLIRNCRDNSDETGCPTEPCIPLQFTCLNGACVSGSALCDGDDDCGDLSDEENCTKSTFMTAAVMGLISCIFLFCIGLSCLYKVYAARLRASAGFAHQLEPEPMDDEFVYREPPPAYSVAVGETGIIPYPASEFTERYFEVDQTSRCQRNRIPRHNRRRNGSSGSGAGSSEQTSTPRSRPTPSSTFTGLASSNVPQFPVVQNQPKVPDCSKFEPTTSRSNFEGVIELLGFNVEANHPQACPQENMQTSTNQSTQCNESPYSSPSLSPSRESVTSSTSLDDHEDLVRPCQS